MVVKDYLDYGALGVSVVVLLISVGILYRVLQHQQRMHERTISVLQDNAAILAAIKETTGSLIWGVERLRDTVESKLRRGGSN